MTVPAVQSLASRSTSLARQLTIQVETTQPFDIVDVTAAIAGVVQGLGLEDGLVMLQTRHTTTGVLINEHEPLLFEDLQTLFERLAPRSAAYAHDDPARRRVNLTPGERRNGHAHCRAALLRASESVAVIDGRLALGRWQRLLFIDCDGGQRRELSVTLLGDYRGSI